MGTQINKRVFQEADSQAFEELLRNETAVLKKWVQEKKMSQASKKEVGLELEGWLLNKKLQPAQTNLKFIKSLEDAHLVSEITKSCVEINSDHYFLQGKMFSRHEASLQKLIRLCCNQVDQENKKFIYIGALPTADASHFTRAALTNESRYYAIDYQMSLQREGNPIYFCISGDEKFTFLADSMAIGGIIAAFQIHLRVGLEESARCYNAAQIIAGPMLALACNSLCLLGRPLWAESRIIFLEQLFQIKKKIGKIAITRAFFGNKYLKESLLELFIENQRNYEVLLPHVRENSQDLFHLRLHNGTIYRWNRPVIGFGQSGQPHFRIEQRFLSAGPSVLDMCANAAFFTGIVHCLAGQEMPLESQLKFEQIKRNFYQAARYGLQAKFYWGGDKKIGAADLLLNILLPLAYKGLYQLEINPDDIKRYLGVIEARIQTLQTGSEWQKRFLEKNDYNLFQLTQTYINLQRGGSPVHEWPID